MAVRYHLDVLLQPFIQRKISITPELEDALREIIDNYIPFLKEEYDPLEEQFNQNIKNGLSYRITYNEFGLIAEEQCGNIKKIYKYMPVVDPGIATPVVSGFICEGYYFEEVVE